MCVLGAVSGPKTLQAIVTDFQDKAAVHHTVGWFKVTMGDDDAVVEKCHSLEANRQTDRQTADSGEKSEAL